MQGIQLTQSTLRSDQDGLIQPAGQEDAEGVDDGRLQGVLFQIIGSTSLRKLGRDMALKERWTCMQRMRELRDPHTLHEWLVSSSPKCGAVLESSKFVDAVRLRIGASFVEDGAECQKCSTPVDNRMAHAQCCDRCNATRGHYKVRD